MGINTTIWWPEFCGNRTPQDAFWNPDLSLNTYDPDVTTCFRRTVLVLVPAVWVLLSTPFYLYSLANRPKINSWWTWSVLNALKMTVSIIVLLAVFFRLLPIIIKESMGVVHSPPSSYISFIVELVVMSLMTFILRLEFIKGVHSHGVSVIFWALLLLCDVINLRSTIIRIAVYGYYPRVTSTMTYLHFVGCLAGLFLQLFSDRKALGPNHWGYTTGVMSSLTYVHFAGSLAGFILQLFSDRKALGPDHFANRTAKDDAMEDVPLLDVSSFKPQILKKKPYVKQTPELHAPWLMRVTHWWITGELFFGLGTQVKFHDLYDIKPGDKAESMVTRLKGHLYRAWGGPTRPKDVFGVEVNYPLVRVLALTIGTPLFIGICLRTVSICLDLSNSLLLRVLVMYIESGDPRTWKGIFLAAAMLIVAFISSLLLHNFYNLFWITGMRCRSILNALVFQKAMRLSVKAKRNSTLGEVINLMSVDGQKLQDVFFTSAHIWEIPIDVFLCMITLDNTVGASAFAGLGVILLIIPIAGVSLSYKIRQLQQLQMQVKDSRIKYLSEVLDSIKIIKLYGWEPPFVNRIHNTRNKELELVTAANVTGAISSVMSITCPYLVSLAIYTVYTQVGGHIMTAQAAFGTMAVINVLYYPVSRIPTSLFAIAQAYVSIKRSNRFLNLEEALDLPNYSDSIKPGTVKLKFANFAWERDAPNTLKSINLNIKAGQLVALVGKVGSGKSSVLSAILGEMLITAGKAKAGGMIGYVPQEPWILHDTLRENVLFGKDMKPVDYRKTLDACALQRDIALLDGGDLTEIAEKGDNLSGGQRARVSLARAVYGAADLYLLDDPLSTVDANVGKHIFQNVIGPNGMLKDKTRVFVTHSMRFMPNVDLVVLLNDGEIVEMGTFDELMAKDGDFSAMYTNALNNPEDDVDSLIQGEVAASGEPKLDKVPQKLITEELMTTGTVPWGVVWEYIKSAGVGRFFTMVTCMILYVVSQVGGNVWLSDWSSDNARHVANATVLLKFSTRWRLAGYGFLGIAQVVTMGAVLFAIAYGCSAAARIMHGKIIGRVVRAPMAFFDTTPLGRIINRFSKDMDILDTNMYIYIAIWLLCTAPIAAALVAISYTIPILLILFVFVAIIYIVVQRAYMNYFRQLRRIDSVRRSPVYTHFYETLVGTSSVKAYRRQADFMDKCYQLIDQSQRAWYLIIVTRRWMGVTMDSVGCLILFFTVLFVTIHRDQVGPGLAGMAVTYALQIIYLQNKLIRFSTELETYLTSIERIHEYTKLKQEKPWKDITLAPPDIWPYTGAIEFIDYSTRYREELDLVLNEINFDINPGEKVGVVGRTGAGKSSLFLALFRIVEPSSGCIVVDGLKITCLGLHDVRSRFAIIPQDPAIFTGTLRMNLDPFSAYTDADLWTALEAVRLKDMIIEWATGLNMEIGETGHNLSLGQRQLVCLARVLLRKPKVLVLDEATAAVDLETDEFIQKTIRSNFPSCTVITIAHRLTTVMDYDKILVMDEGRVCEFDSPEKLMDTPTSRFYNMARQAGIQVASGSDATTISRSGEETPPEDDTKKDN